MIMKKIILNETFYIKEEIPSILKIDFDFLKNYFLTNIIVENKLNSDNNNLFHLNNYYKINFHQQLQWLSTHITDSFNSEHSKILSGVSSGLFPYLGYVLKKNEIKDFHNFLLNNDVHYCAILNLNESEMQVMFKHKNDINENCFTSEKIKNKEFLFFNSNVLFSIDNRNNNKESLVLFFLFELAKNNF